MPNETKVDTLKTEPFELPIAAFVPNIPTSDNIGSIIALKQKPDGTPINVGKYISSGLIASVNWATDNTTVYVVKEQRSAGTGENMVDEYKVLKKFHALWQMAYPTSQMPFPKVEDLQNGDIEPNREGYAYLLEPLPDDSIITRHLDSQGYVRARQLVEPMLVYAQVNELLAQSEGIHIIDRKVSDFRLHPDGTLAVLDWNVQGDGSLRSLVPRDVRLFGKLFYEIQMGKYCMKDTSIWDMSTYPAAKEPFEDVPLITKALFARLLDPHPQLVMGAGLTNSIEHYIKSASSSSEELEKNVTMQYEMLNQGMREVKQGNYSHFAEYASSLLYVAQGLDLLSKRGVNSEKYQERVEFLKGLTATPNFLKGAFVDLIQRMQTGEDINTIGIRASTYLHLIPSESLGREMLIKFRDCCLFNVNSNLPVSEKDRQDITKKIVGFVMSHSEPQKADILTFVKELDRNSAVTKNERYQKMRGLVVFANTIRDFSAGELLDSFVDVIEQILIFRASGTKISMEAVTFFHELPNTFQKLALICLNEGEEIAYTFSKYGLSK